MDFLMSTFVQSLFSDTGVQFQVELYFQPIWQSAMDCSWPTVCSDASGMITQYGFNKFIWTSQAANLFPECEKSLWLVFILIMSASWLLQSILILGFMVDRQHNIILNM